MNGDEAAKAQADYAPTPSNSMGLDSGIDAVPCGHAVVAPLTVGEGVAPLFVGWQPTMSDCVARYTDCESAIVSDLPGNETGEADSLHTGRQCNGALHMGLPTDPAARKSIPMCTGLLDYFPDALAAVAMCSKAGNDQHNRNQPLHWAREKSSDHADCIVRHLVDRGRVDTDGVSHSAKVAWRALALLQLEIESVAHNDK